MVIMAKRYPLEFRNDVVAVARRRADSLSSIARDFGISEATLYNWLKRADINEGVRDGMTSAEAEQIRELKRRNKVLEQEVEILRRAATYFARHLPPK
jgi:transposase-like protein